MKKFTPKKPEKVVISIRADLDLVNKVDHFAAKNEISRNAFLNQGIQHIITSLEEEEAESAKEED